GGVTTARLPPDVRLVRDATAVASLGNAAWLLLLGEHETAEAELASTVAEITRTASVAYRIPIEIETLGIRLAARAQPVRLAPRERCTVGLDRGLELELVVPSAPTRRLDVGLRAHRGASVAAALDTLAPESRALAALLAEFGARPGAMELTSAPL